MFILEKQAGFSSRLILSVIPPCRKFIISHPAGGRSLLEKIVNGINHIPHVDYPIAVNVTV
jgi:hypothetical protein